ncbi:MAG TPA: hypothetical protein VFK60_13950 [Casimicrobiaceae bacterium]|nr:hypothetical protein [Casimicrobiaceae bacterium]
MTNQLTFKLMGPGSATPAVRALPQVHAPQSEGFGLVRRPAAYGADAAHAADAAQPPHADAANDRHLSPDPRGDSSDLDLRTAMSPSQRDALHALTHARAAVPGARWARRDRGIDFVWAGTLALLLALAASSIDCGRIFVATADRLHAVAEARSAVRAARATAVETPAETAEAPRAAVASQSSPGTSRTM